MELRPADRGDIPTLLTFMSAFYAESGHEVDREVVQAAFNAILSDDRLGSVWLIHDQSSAVGYIVLTLRFAMEYGGLIACLDDLFISEESRNKGLSTAALLQAIEFCRDKGFLAMTVEVGCGSLPAQALYRRVGFAEAQERRLFALTL